MKKSETEGAQVRPLDGLRFLVIEDEYYIADDLRRTLEGSGAEVVGPVGTLSSARSAVEAGDFDWVILDLNLHGELSIGIADDLTASGRNFIICTGYSGTSVPRRLMNAPRLKKPFEPERIFEIVKAVRAP